MADSRIWSWEVLHEPGTFCKARKQGNAQKLLGAYQKDIGTSWRIIQCPMLEKNLSKKWMMTGMK